MLLKFFLFLFVFHSLLATPPRVCEVLKKIGRVNTAFLNDHEIYKKHKTIIDAVSESTENNIEETKHTEVYQDFKPILNKIPPVIAKKKQMEILERINISAKLAKQNTNESLREAYKNLNDQKIFHDSGFELPGEWIRSHYNISSNDLTLTAEQIIEKITSQEKEKHFRNGVKTHGEIVIPNVNIIDHGVKIDLWDKKLDSIPTIKQLRWEILRTTTEEFAHVAEILKEHSGEGPYLALDKNMQQKIKTYKKYIQQSELNTEPFSSYPIEHEADVYEYLIKVFGIENVPKKYGVRSQYYVRELIDKKYGRQWQRGDILLSP